MSSEVLGFLEQLDQELANHASPGERVDLYLLGRCALILRQQMAIATKDIDIVLTQARLEEKAYELFKQGSSNAQRLGLYLDRVPEGLPPLPGGYRKRSEELPGNWRVIRPRLLDNHDLAASKLRSFRATDRQDVQTLCDLGLLDPVTLRDRLESAFRWSLDKDGDEHRDRAFANLGLVLRYMKGEISAL
jgi:hypothetical protein